MGQKGRFPEFEPYAVTHKTGLKARRPQVIFCITQLLGKLDRFLKEGLTICLRAGFQKNRIMNLPACPVGLNKFMFHFTDGKHTGLIHLISMVTDSKIHKDRFMCPHDSETCPHGKGG